ncbi:MAG TPA: hypothetical protein VK141_02505, partial [Nitrosomonas sp.]|nr:hypothetical protein [Nitrosomonas sp.]
MKSFIIGLLIAAPLLIHNPLLAQPTQYRAEESVVAQKRQFIIADITGFPIGHTLSGSWQPLQSVRVGYGWQQSKWVELRLCADYTWFDFDDSEGWIYGGKYSKGKRRDLSVYPAI